MGSGQTTENGLRGAPPPLRFIWVSRAITNDTNIVKDYIQKNGVNVSCIEKVSHENAKFSSFKIGISKDAVDKVMDEKFWPKGVGCRYWRSKTEVSAQTRARDSRVNSEDNDNANNAENSNTFF